MPPVNLNVFSKWTIKFDPSTNQQQAKHSSIVMIMMRLNSQSFEDTQVEYISQKYTLDQYTLEKYTLEKYT